MIIQNHYAYQAVWRLMFYLPFWSQIWKCGLSLQTEIIENSTSALDIKGKLTPLRVRYTQCPKRILAQGNGLIDVKCISGTTKNKIMTLRAKEKMRIWEIESTLDLPDIRFTK